MTESWTFAAGWTPILSAPAICDCWANGYPSQAVWPHAAVQTALDQHMHDMNHLVDEFAHFVRGFLSLDDSCATPSGEGRIAS